MVSDTTAYGMSELTRKEYEGDEVCEVDGRKLRRCNYSGDCIWRVDFNFLVADTGKKNLKPFDGYVCNCPDEMRFRKDCPERWLDWS